MPHNFLCIRSTHIIELNFNEQKQYEKTKREIIKCSLLLSAIQMYYGPCGRALYQIYILKYIKTKINEPIKWVRIYSFSKWSFYKCASKLGTGNSAKLWCFILLSTHHTTRSLAANYFLDAEIFENFTLLTTSYSSTNLYAPFQYAGLKILDRLRRPGAHFVFSTYVRALDATQDIWRTWPINF